MRKTMSGVDHPVNSAVRYGRARLVSSPRHCGRFYQKHPIAIALHSPWPIVKLDAQCRRKDYPESNHRFGVRLGQMWAFSAMRKAEGLSLAATNRLHIRQYDSIRGDMPRTGRCSNRGAGDFEDIQG